MMKRKVGVQARSAAVPSRRSSPAGMRSILLAGVIFCMVPAHATEGGGNSYPFGVETSYNGVMLAEGGHFFVYFQHYRASHFKDNNGDDNTKFANFKFECNVMALRFSYVWPGVRLFGANVETRIVQPIVDGSLDAAIARPAPLSAFDVGGNRAGLADTSFSPIILGWHSPHYHQTIGLDSHLKTGNYDASNRVNTGRNYYQVAPFYALTWFPAKGFDVNTKIRYAFNSKNTATKYQSGDEATVEFGAGYHASASFAFGLSGYVYRQTTDDKLNGVSVNGNGNRGSVNALGPYVSYSFTPKFTVIMKVQSEFDARNRPEGRRIWAQTRIPF